MKYNETEMLDYISKTAHKMNVENNYNYGVGSEPGGEIENSLLDLDKWSIMTSGNINDVGDKYGLSFYFEELDDEYPWVTEERFGEIRDNNNITQFWNEDFCEGLVCWVVTDERDEEVLGLFWESS